MVFAFCSKILPVFGLDFLADVPSWNNRLYNSYSLSFWNDRGWIMVRKITHWFWRFFFSGKIFNNSNLNHNSNLYLLWHWCFIWRYSTCFYQWSSCLVWLCSTNICFFLNCCSFTCKTIEGKWIQESSWYSLFLLRW